MENIFSLFISLFIFFTAFIVIFQSFSSIFNFFKGTPRSLSFTPLTFLFLLVSTLNSLILMIYLKLINKKTGSPIIESEAKEKRYDLFISISVIIGFIGISINLYILDSIISLLIALFILLGLVVFYMEDKKHFDKLYFTQKKRSFLILGIFILLDFILLGISFFTAPVTAPTP